MPAFTAATAAVTAATATSAATAIGATAAIAGAATNAYGGYQAAAASKRAEKVRLAQMRAEADNKRRNAIREAMIARGRAVNSAGATGSVNPGNSLISAIDAGTSAAYGVSEANVAENFGEQMFAANAAASEARGLASLGQGISGIGQTVLNNNAKLGKLFATEGGEVRPRNTALFPLSN